jgi:hypothetical protein
MMRILERNTLAIEAVMTRVSYAIATRTNTETIGMITAGIRAGINTMAMVMVTVVIVEIMVTAVVATTTIINKSQYRQNGPMVYSWF